MRHGDTENGSLMAGQCASMVVCIQPAAEIVSDLAAEAEAVMKSLASRVSV
jgi:NAD(P)H-dependent flavin oxidoreductase YrpB (nitropropane dioxygenase family)